MDHPEVWFALGRFIHEDFALVFPNVCEGVRSFVAGIDSKDKQALVEHLTLLLTNAYSDTDLATAWWDSGADMYVDPAETRDWLREIERCLVDE
jgi:hypothetical protein